MNERQILKEVEQHLQNYVNEVGSVFAKRSAALLERIRDVLHQRGHVRKFAIIIYTDSNRGYLESFGTHPIHMPVMFSLDEANQIIMYYKKTFANDTEVRDNFLAWSNKQPINYVIVELGWSLSDHISQKLITKHNIKKWGY